MLKNQIISKQWILQKRPDGNLTEENFAWREVPVGNLSEGQVLVRHLYLSLDPTNRVWANSNDSYLPAVRLGDVMRGVGVGIVEDSRNEGFSVGDYVFGLLGFESRPVLQGDVLTKFLLPEGVPLSAYHTLLGTSGATAYFGLIKIGQPQPGETLVVSAAAGAVGSLVGQIGKKEGCRVVGLAGSDDKCQWLTEALGFDAAINYRTQDVDAELKKYCPQGIDIYFDNVGGDILDAALSLINNHARIPLCGMISTYNDKELRPGPKNMFNVLIKRARLEGFIVTDFMDHADEAYTYLSDAYAAGDIKFRIEMIDGLERAPQALDLLFTGGNKGKLTVKVDPEWND